jgi:uncharacterized protein
MVPVALLTAAGVQVLCQLYKVGYYSVRHRKLEPHYLVSAGGMPSAHSAFVTALTVAVGMRAGPATEVFSVAFVFATIVVYDSLRLRRTVQQQSQLLNRLVRRYHPEETGDLSEMVGHTPAEVIAGVLAGGVLSGLVTWLLMQAGA